MKVMFFPLKFIPTDEQKKKLEEMQEFLHYARIEYLQAQKYRSPYYAKIAEDRYNEAVRNCIKQVEMIESES
jgi:hypothetical protein